MVFKLRKDILVDRKDKGLFKSFTFRKTKINKKKSFFGFDSSQIEADSS